MRIMGKTRPSEDVTYLAAVAHVAEVVQLALVPKVPLADDRGDHDARRALELDRRVRLTPAALGLETSGRRSGGQDAMRRARILGCAHLLHLEAELVTLLPRTRHMVLRGALAALDDRAVFSIAQRAVLRARR